MSRVGRKWKVFFASARRRALAASLLALLLFCGCAPSAAAPSPLPASPAPTAASPAPSPASPVPASTPPASAPPASAPPAPRMYDAPPGSYTFAWISDPQIYSELYPETYFSMMRFLSAERERLKLQYLVCTGDLVNHYNRPEEWAAADKAFLLLDGVPYGVLAGNHDIRVGEPDGCGAYLRTFGAKRFANAPYYAECFADNLGHCDLIDAGNTRYVFVYLSIRPGRDGYDFALSCFRKYPDRVGVLCVHDYCDETMELSAEGRRFYKYVVREADNLHLVLCGHRYGVRHRTDTVQNADGSVRQVLTMLQNYQSAPRAGDGYLGLLRVNEAEGVLDILRYSPVWDDVNLYDECVERTGFPNGNSFVESVTLPLPWLEPQ